jgi:hypothetical protein
LQPPPLEPLELLELEDDPPGGTQMCMFGSHVAPAANVVQSEFCWHCVSFVETMSEHEYTARSPTAVAAAAPSARSRRDIDRVVRESSAWGMASVR